MRNNLLLVFSCLCFVLISCDSNQVFDEYRSVPNQWHKDEIIEFNVVPPDTINAYDLFVNVRNTSDFKYNNLFLIVEMNFPNGKVNIDTLEYRMTTPEGKFIGTGFTDVKENKLWYRGHESPFIFQENGEYKIKIQHAMRANGSVDGIVNLDGIIDIGLRIERPQSKN